MENKLERRIKIYSSIDKEIHMKNTAAEINITKGKEPGTIIFQSSGLVVAFNGGGGDEIDEKHPLFNEASKLAKAVVKKGGLIMNGGRNSGIMESTSRAAQKFSLGVNFVGQVKKGVVSQYGQILLVDGPLTRLALLTNYPPIVVVYKGGLGTFHELINGIISIKNNIKYGLPAPRILVYKSWRKILEILKKQGAINATYLSHLSYFSTPKSALKLIFEV